MVALGDALVVACPQCRAPFLPATGRAWSRALCGPCEARRDELTRLELPPIFPTPRLDARVREELHDDRTVLRVAPRRAWLIAAAVSLAWALCAVPLRGADGPVFAAITSVVFGAIAYATAALGVNHRDVVVSEASLRFRAGPLPWPGLELALDELDTVRLESSTEGPVAVFRTAECPLFRVRLQAAGGDIAIPIWFDTPYEAGVFATRVRAAIARARSPRPPREPTTYRA